MYTNSKFKSFRLNTKNDLFVSNERTNTQTGQMICALRIRDFRPALKACNLSLSKDCETKNVNNKAKKASV